MVPPAAPYGKTIPPSSLNSSPFCTHATLVEREAAEDETSTSHIAPMNDERRAAAANAASHQAQKQAAPLAIAAGAI